MVGLASLALGACQFPELPDLTDGTEVDAPPPDGPSAPPRLAVDPVTVTVTEGAQRSFSVALTSPPAGRVNVTLQSNDDAKLTVAPANIYFEPTDWSTAQNITVTGREDEDVEDEPQQVTIGATFDNVIVDVTVDDNDTLAVVATPEAGLDVSEQGAATLNVHLSARPSGPVTIEVVSADPGAATVTPAQLTFTTLDWADDKPVTVAGTDDADTTHEDTVVNLTGGAGVTAAAVPVHVTDNDVLGILPSTTNLGDLPEGETGTFTVRLTQQPPADVTVTVATDDAAVATATPATLTFTATTWSTPQTVTVAVPEDVNVANEATAIRLSAPGGVDTRSVAVGSTDDDVLAVVATPSPLAVVEGQSQQLSVELAYQPSAPVTLSVTSMNGAVAGAAPATLTFQPASYDVAQNVTVSAPHDLDAIAASTTLRLEAAALGLLHDVPVAVTDDDQLLLQTSLGAITLSESGTATFGVRLTAMPVTPVVVNISSSDVGAAAVAPAALTFSTQDWDSFQTVTVSGVADLDLAAENLQIALATNEAGTASVGVTVTDDDVQVVQVSPGTLSVNEGGTATFGVRLGFAPPDNVAVTVASADATAATAAPATLTFTPTDYATAQTVTITGVDDADAMDDTTTVSATAGASTATVTVTVNDDEALGIETDVTTTTVTEAGTAIVRVRLTAQPAGNTTVTATSSDPGAATVAPATVSFTTTDWNTYKNLTISGVDDADAAAEDLTLALTSPPLAGRSVAVTVTDDDVLGIVLSSTTVSLGEAGSTTFGVSLSAQPAGDVTVVIGSGDVTAATVSPASLTFTTANYATPRNVTVSGVTDVDLATETVPISLSSPQGLPARTVTATVTDDDTQVILATPGAITVAEGGSGTVGLRLGYQPAADVTVTVTSASAATATVAPASLTFTRDNFATSQNITIAGAQDADATTDTTTVSATAPGATAAAVDVTVTDDDVLGIDLSTTALTVNEGGTATFQVRLTAQPAASTSVTIASNDAAAATTAPTSLTFTTASWNAYQTVTVSGVADLDTVNESPSLSVQGAGLMPRAVALTVVDDDTQVIQTSVGTVSLGEAGSTTFGVRLAYMPTADVTVAVASLDTGAAAASPASLTFTAANYATQQTVTIAGVADLDLASETVTIRLTSPGLANRDVAASVADDDTQVVLATPGAITVGEGGSGTVGLRLGYQPAGDVTVTVASASAATATVTPTTLTFTPATYATNQNVTIAGTQDTNATSDTTTVSATAPGATAAAVDVTVTDDDVLGIDLSSSALTVNEGGTGTFQIRLTAQPAANTSVTISTNDAGAATAAPTPLTFTTANWSTYQTVTVSGIADLDTVNESPSLSVQSAGLTPRTVALTVVDDDVQGIQTSVGTVSLGEAGSTTFGVRLAHMPTADVTVSATSLDTGAATVSPASLTFTAANYATQQTVTVTGVADVDLASELVTIRLTSAGLANRDVAATVTDDDTQVVEVAPSPLTLTEGGTGEIGVRLRYQPADNVTVSLSSTNPAVATVNPTTLTFTPADYATPKPVTVTAPHDTDLAAGSTTLRATATGATDGTASVTVNDDDQQTVIVSQANLMVTEGSSSTVTVRLGFAPSANVTVTMSSASTAVATVTTATTPTLTFTPANYATPQTVTIHGTQDNNLAVGNTTVTADIASGLDATVAVTVSDDDTQEILAETASVTILEGTTSTTAVRFSLRYVPSGPVTVNVASLNTGVATVSPASLSFTVADYATWKAVNVTTLQDANIADGNVVISATEASSTPANVTVTVDDDDVQAIQLAPGSLALTEGGTGTLTVSLAYMPAGNVVVDLVSSNTAAATLAAPSVTLTPSNYATGVAVGVLAPHDQNLAPGSATITATAASAPSAATAGVTVADDDTQRVVVTPTSLTMTEGGATQSFAVSLEFAPSSNVGVGITSDNILVATAAPASLTFTPANYATTQQVTVTAVQDADTANNTARITAMAASATPGTVDVSVTDNDVTLTVATAGVGSGAVTATVGGSPVISNCAGTCTANVDRNAAVTLTAAQAGADLFYRWTAGPCAATTPTNPTCTFTISAATSATATFDNCARSTQTCSAGAFTQCNASGDYVSFDVPNGSASGDPITLVMNNYSCPLGCHASGTRCGDISASNGLNTALDHAATSPSGIDLPADLPAGRTITAINTSTFDSVNGLTTVTLDDNTSATVPAEVKVQSGAPEILVLKVRSFKVPSGTTITVSGTRALAIVSHFDIYVAGTMDLSGPVGGPGRLSVAGCNGTFVTGSYSASGGAHYGGGGTSSGGAAGGQPAQSPFHTPLAGGCTGGAGTQAIGGVGGGALQLVSRTKTVIAATGLINVSGGGGYGHCTSALCTTYRATGGGAGGAVAIESPAITLVTGAVVAGRGGGGGASNSGTTGANGSPGTTTGSANGPGATCTGCGVGGVGGTESTLGGTAGTGTAPAAGGGGGGVGRCVTRNFSGTLTPPAGMMKLSFQNFSLPAAR